MQKTTGLTKYLEIASAEGKAAIAQLVDDFYNQLRFAKDPFTLASQYIDGLLSAAINKIPDFKISCTKGCWYCCQINCLISEVEAKKISPYIERKKIIPLKTRKDNRCPFLNDHNECNIYPARPLICRKTLVSSDPAYCDTRNGEPKNVQLQTDIRIEALITAFWLFSKPRDIRDFFGNAVDIR